MTDATPLEIRYLFAFAEGEIVPMVVRLDRTSLALISGHRTEPPDWTRLAFAQCPNCRLAAALHSHCPIATSLVSVVELFANRFSHEPVRLKVVTEERETSAQTSLQNALSSLIGILMVTSGCPTMDLLRPMVRFHLPLATGHETLYRAVSMYLLAQYLRSSVGLVPDWTLDGLEASYEGVHRLNLAIARRVRDAAVRDASANALVRLDLFADDVACSLKDSLVELRYLFSGYMDA
jgi:hypothetical protein